MTLHLNSMGDALRVIVIGASGGIGQGFIHHLRHSSQVTEIYALSRKGTAPSCDKVTPMAFDFTDEGNIIAAANFCIRRCAKCQCRCGTDQDFFHFILHK